MAFSAFDRIALATLLMGGVLLAGRGWLADHPQHDPWAPLTLDQPEGWATSRKIAALRDDRGLCRNFLKRSGIDFEALAPQGQGTCRRDDRKVLSAPAFLDVSLVPAQPQATCAVDGGLAWWLRHGVQPAAKAIFGQQVVRIEHLGTNHCRRIGNGSTGRWSEHSRGNAIDIAAFVLADGQRISVLRDWKTVPGQSSDDAAFLHMARDAACRSFSTVLSPDYNAAHANHLHLDQARRTGGWSACR
ncbi:extensin-like domain-containing protein [Novosphingobium sp. Leaf2]|uniref:extensin-like domain-containing protein n=1 Tax=Novosphingobium sp. Leaf2 TaxID=1735670 RepID=UPI0006FF3016|nr:extensin family protein [Novosphingobium sp. Leaf2]KQM17316.1 extensin [Novosphingobium sp. Leaf2]